MSYEDHGPLSDATDTPYCAAPRFTITRSDEASRYVYEARCEARNALSYLERMVGSIDRAERWKATDEQLEGLKGAARDCELALAAVIAKLCREPGYGSADQRRDEVA